MTTPYGEALDSPLEVTKDHRLLTNVSNDGWTAVGELAASEYLVGIIGGIDYLFNVAPSDNNTHADAVYNLSCSTPDAVNEARSNFLVSPDGVSWIPAHNIKQYE